MRSITSELKGLVRNGISDIYVCDSEFNMPLRHSRQVCSALIREGLGDKLRWHAFINPVPFDVEVAELMKRSGCASLSITADSGDDTILRKYGKNFSGDDLKCVARICHRLNLDFRCTLLLGGPGETRETIRRTIDLMKELEPDHVEVITGMRVYPNTPLASFVRRQGMSSYPNLHGNCSRNQDFLKPIFYISSAVGPEIQEITQEMIGNDPRFTLGSTDMISSGVGRMMSEVLPAINQGYRGPAWHFLSNHLNRISP